MAHAVAAWLLARAPRPARRRHHRRGAGVALAPAAAAALPALVLLNLNNNPLGDEGLAALVAPPQKAGTPPPPLECWRSSVRSSSATPRSPTLAVTPSPPRLRTVRCRRSTRWGWKASLPSAAAQDALYAAHLNIGAVFKQPAGVLLKRCGMTPPPPHSYLTKGLDDVCLSV